MGTPLPTYWDMLDRFDWSYENSDDRRAYDSGRAGLAQLKAIAAESPAHKALFEDFKAHMDSVGSGGTKKPKPPRPA